jgi:hypothetical protein
MKNQKLFFFAFSSVLAFFFIIYPFFLPFSTFFDISHVFPTKIQTLFTFLILHLSCFFSTLFDPFSSILTVFVIRSYFPEEKSRIFDFFEVSCILAFFFDLLSFFDIFPCVSGRKIQKLCSFLTFCPFRLFSSSFYPLLHFPAKNSDIVGFLDFSCIWPFSSFFDPFFYSFFTVLDIGCVSKKNSETVSFLDSSSIVAFFFMI